MANFEFSNVEKKLATSKLKISKNFMFYMIVPIIIFLVGIILACTVGFNLGTDFTGASTFKLYVNSDANTTLSEDLKKYDLNKKDDYSVVYNKVKAVLNDNGLKIVSYRISSMNISEYKVFNGQAIEVVYRNKATGKDIQFENESIRGQLITAFKYSDYDKAISTIDQTMGHSAFNYSMEILAALVVGLAAIIIYMLFRKMRGACVMMIMQVALDLLLALCLFLICRPVVNLTIGIAILTTFILSVINSFVFLDKIRNNSKSGKYEKMKSNEIADYTVKELFLKRGLFYLLLVLFTIIFAVVSTLAIRELTLAILIILFSTFYTSNFLMPALWATTYNKKKKKKYTAQ